MRFAIRSFWILRVFVSITLLVAVAAGCSGRPKNFARRVSGKVTVGGQPLVGASIMFTPVEKGSPSTGSTNNAGEYELYWPGNRRGRPVEGAQIGEHVVRISTFADAVPKGKPPRPEVPEKVPFKYRLDPLPKATVKAGVNTIDFELEAGPIEPPQPKGKAKGKGK